MPLPKKQEKNSKMNTKTGMGERHYGKEIEKWNKNMRKEMKQEK